MNVFRRFSEILFDLRGHLEQGRSEVKHSDFKSFFSAYSCSQKVTGLGFHGFEVVTLRATSEIQVHGSYGNTTSKAECVLLQLMVNSHKRRSNQLF